MKRIALTADPQEIAECRPFPLNPSYLVHPSGRVLNFRGTAWLRPCIMKRGGYFAVNLWSGKGRGHLWTLNKIVAWTFRGAPTPPRIHAAHEDGDKSHNAVENIFWKTKVENEADKIRHGTTNRGERNGQAKLTDVQCSEIRAAWSENPIRGMQRRLAEKYGVTDGAISNIINGKRRLHAA